VGDVSSESVERLSMAQLMELYYEIMGTRRKTTFQTRLVGVGRIQTLLGQVTDGKRQPVVPADVVPIKTARTNLPPRERQVVPVTPKPRRLFELLSLPEGVTIEEAAIDLGTPIAETKTRIHNLHWNNGYGIREGEDGRLRIMTSIKQTAQPIPVAVAEEEDDNLMEVDLTLVPKDRFEFLRKVTGLSDGALVRAMVLSFDRTYGAKADGDRVVILSRNGRIVEDITP
jgi:hypothetical protein